MYRRIPKRDGVILLIFLWIAVVLLFGGRLSGSAGIDVVLFIFFGLFLYVIMRRSGVVRIRIKHGSTTDAERAKYNVPVHVAEAADRIVEDSGDYIGYGEAIAMVQDSDGDDKDWDKLLEVVKRIEKDSEEELDYDEALILVRENNKTSEEWDQVCQVANRLVKDAEDEVSYETAIDVALTYTEPMEEWDRIFEIAKLIMDEAEDGFDYEDVFEMVRESSLSTKQWNKILMTANKIAKDSDMDYDDAFKLARDLLKL